MHAIGVEQCERWIAQRRRTLDERFGKRGALQKAERRCRMKLDIHGGWPGTGAIDTIDTKDADGGVSVHDAVHEPGVSAAMAEQTVGGAVAERHVPLVAIP